MNDNLLKQAVKALEPFAELVEADRSTRPGPWTCEIWHDKDGRKHGCGRNYPRDQALCPACVPNYGPHDKIIDIAGVGPSRTLWRSQLHKAHRTHQLLTKQLAKQKGGDAT